MLKITMALAFVMIAVSAMAKELYKPVTKLGVHGTMKPIKVGTAASSASKVKDTPLSKSFAPSKVQNGLPTYLPPNGYAKAVKDAQSGCHGLGCPPVPSTQYKSSVSH
jgi:hypothetical protein